MARFFLSLPEIPPAGSVLALTGEQALHGRALRLRPGESVTVCDGAGTDCRCTVERAAPDRLELRVDGTEPSRGEPRVQITLFTAFAKADKLEHVVMKATELGAAAVTVFPSERCVSRPDRASLDRKLERWRKIAASAAEQSGRGRIPPVRVEPSFEAALRHASEHDAALFLYENESKTSLRAALPAAGYAAAAIVTGPEGGFSPAEAEAARTAGLSLCTLGPRILRCETAPLCALSALLFACGELDAAGGFES